VTERVEWVLLAYRMPREPSTPRIAVWRRLRRLGAAQVVDGLVALPADTRTREQLDRVAEGVLEAGGEASIWVGRLGTAAQERSLVARMSQARAVEYRQVGEAAAEAAVALRAERVRVLARLRRELDRLGQRDFFPTPERHLARAAVDDLAASVGAKDAGDVDMAADADVAGDVALLTGREPA
jgi:hypothetical protein